MHPDLQPVAPVPLRPVPMTVLEATIPPLPRIDPVLGTGEQEVA
jgi:hypothetical protein